MANMGNALCSSRSRPPPRLSTVIRVRPSARPFMRANRTAGGAGREMSGQREEGQEEKGGITPLEWKWERGLAPVAPPRWSGNNSPGWFSGKHPFDEVHNAA